MHVYMYICMYLTFIYLIDERVSLSTYRDVCIYVCVYMYVYV